jgi:hypothetical protein
MSLGVALTEPNPRAGQQGRSPWSASPASLERRIFMQRISVLPFVMGLVICIPACGSEHLTAIEDRRSALSASEQPLLGDPFGACDAETFTCSAPRAGCGGWTEETPQGAVSRVSCNHACASDTDCPSPWSGDARPVCHDQLCQLPCDERVTCPNGFSCVAPSSASAGTYLDKVCMQTFDGTLWAPATQ